MVKRAGNRLEETGIPAWCFGWGLFVALLAVWVFTEDRAVAFKKLVGFPEFPDYALFQAARWLRCLFVAFGVSLLAAGLLWKRIAGNLLAGDLFERVSEKRISGILLFTTLPVYVLLEAFVFQKFPFTPDEFAYLFQAKVLASGSLSTPAHPLQKFFTSAFIACSEGRLFSIMPPGWSFFLVPWVWLKVPWIVNPLLSSCNVLLVFLIGNRIYNRTTGCAAAFLTAVSPFFLYMSGTFFAHPLSLFLVLAVTYGYVRIEARGGGWFSYMLFGLLLAMIPIVHHFDIFLVFPMLWILAIRFFRVAGPPRRKILLLAVVFVVTISTFTSWYNASLTGSAIEVPHEVYLDDGNFLGEIPTYAPMVGIASFGQFKARVRRLLDQILQLNLVMFPLAPVLVFVSILLAGRSRWDVILTAAVLCMFVAYLFYWCRGGFQFGPRYYYPAVGFFYLLIFRGFSALHERANRNPPPQKRPNRPQRMISLAFVLVICFQLGVSSGVVLMVKDAADYARIIEDVGGWFESRGVRNSIIFLSPSREDPNTDANKIFLRVRNEPEFSDTNLTASDRGEENVELMDHYPDRRYYLYEIDIERLVRGKEMRWREIRRNDYVKGVRPERDA